MCPRHQRYVMRSHFQRMKSFLGFKACRRFESTTFIVKTPRNAKPSHSTRQPKAPEVPQLSHDLLNPFLSPRPPAKIPRSKNIWITSKYPPLALFPHLFATPHKEHKPKLVRAPDIHPCSEFYSQQKYCATPPFSPQSTEVFTTPFSAMFGKQHWFFTQPQARRIS